MRRDDGAAEATWRRDARGAVGRRHRATAAACSRRDLRWLVVVVGVLLLVQIMRIPDLRLHFVTGASLTQGALIAAIALGVVLTYRGSGVVNFATGAIAMYVAYVYTELRTERDPVPPAVAESRSRSSKASCTSSAAATTSACPTSRREISLRRAAHAPGRAGALARVLRRCMGLALHFLVFRPLRTAPPLAKVVASVGVLLLLQAIVIRRFGTAATRDASSATARPSK